jgi:hypothetical protein
VHGRHARLPAVAEATHPNRGSFGAEPTRRRPPTGPARARRIAKWPWVDLAGRHPGSPARRNAGEASTPSGIAAIGTALFGSGSGGKPGATDPYLVSTAQLATIVNLGFILAAFGCGLALPRTLGAERADENR